ncbi:MAG: GGDEF domain-containing protein [Desulfobulbus sp.]|nr:GGDEF domain-containing protein [Desulfobulbus sp.]
MARALDRTLQNILTSADLPTLPAVASKVLELTALEEVPLIEVITLITQDIALSAKILKVANSAFYNFPQQIGSVQQAVSLLGTNAIRCLVLSFSFLSMGQEKKTPIFDLNTFWERSLVAAAAARLIAEQTGQTNPEEIFTLGLLQDIGQLIFALTLPCRYDHLLEQLSTDKEHREVELEEEYLGLPHTISGSEVARAWGLPESIVITLRYHHTPLLYEKGNAQHALALKIVYLSNLVAQIFVSTTPLQCQNDFEEKAYQLLGLEKPQITTIFRIINKEIEKSAHFFGVTIKPVRPVAEIIQEANIRLSLLHLSYEEINRELRRTKKALEAIRVQLSERNQLLERLAHLDGLTEIHNHRYFQSFLRTEIARAAHNRRPISLLLADIDHFKQFNDCYGHQTGDFILKELCQAARTTIREYDLMARYGGEEFVFVLPEADANAARVVAEKIRRTVAEHDFSDGIRHYRVTLSIGVVTAHPADSTLCQNEFIDQSDQALYEAKNRGRNQVAFYQNPIRSKWRPL